jgi:hypothetical protein
LTSKALIRKFIFRTYNLELESNLFQNTEKYLPAGFLLDNIYNKDIRTFKREIYLYAQLENWETPMGAQQTVPKYAVLH